MKTLILAFLFSVSISTFSGFSIQNQIPNSGKNTTHLKVYEWVEYICIAGQWYKVIHLDNGDSIYIPVSGPQLD